MYKLYLGSNSSNLLNEALKDVTNKNIIYGKYGKPYLESNELYFNKSHSKDKEVIVTSNYEIGVDIEHITYKENVFKKVFNKEEQKDVNESSNKSAEFTKIWVMKEAYVKMNGQGLSYGLLNVDTTKLTNVNLIIAEDYIIAVCEKERGSK